MRAKTNWETIKTLPESRIASFAKHVIEKLTKGTMTVQTSKRCFKWQLHCQGLLSRWGKDGITIAASGMTIVLNAFCKIQNVHRRKSALRVGLKIEFEIANQKLF